MGEGMKQIVLSGVNITEMGPAIVFENALKAAVELYGDRYEIVAIVHRKSLFSVAKVIYREFPEVKVSWLRRLVFEYFTLNKISRSMNVELWVSMHDMTPNVKAERRAVYCHNPAPFYSIGPREALANWKLAAFVLGYGYLYEINIHKNDMVIVQQDWIRQAFLERYNLKRVVVAHPVTHLKESGSAVAKTQGGSHIYTFFYPAYPRPFKNYEVILKSAALLEQECTGQFEVWLTLDAGINPYAAELYSQYHHLRNVVWLGLLPHAKVMDRYAQVDCLLFPSRLETWGLPISEFKATGKPMFVADLPYAKETVGTYDQVTFFQAMDSRQLAEYMKEAIQGNHMFSNVLARGISPPFATDWYELWNYLMAGTEQ
jgi:glycosyltransferase involved in cell wall biosynthesis